MGKSQRIKGAVFERDVAHMFSARFGREFKRNIGQARDGGNDIDVGPLVVEAKRRASLKGLRAWMAQAQAAADTRGGASIAVVVMREDNGPEPMVLLGFGDFIDMVEQAGIMDEQ